MTDKAIDSMILCLQRRTHGTANYFVAAGLSVFVRPSTVLAVGSNREKVNLTSWTNYLTNG